MFVVKYIEYVKVLLINLLFMYLVMDVGKFIFDLFVFGLVGGKVDGCLVFDGSYLLMFGQVWFDVCYIKFKVLFFEFDVMCISLGEINGCVDFDVKGNFVVVLLGSVDGEFKLLMNDGVVSKNLLEIVGFNVGNIIFGKLFGDCMVEINCVVIDFKVIDGLFCIQLFVFDIKDVVINVDGMVNMSNEKFDLDVKLQIKGLCILLLCLLLYVCGMLKDLDVGVQVGLLVLCVGGVVVLGIVVVFVVVLLVLILFNYDQLENICQVVLQQLCSVGKLKVSELVKQCVK